MRARFPFHPIGVSHWSTPFDTQRHADFCRTRCVGVRGLPGHAVGLVGLLHVVVVGGWVGSRSRGAVVSPRQS